MLSQACGHDVIANDSYKSPITYESNFSPCARAYLSISLCIEGFVCPNFFGNHLSGNDLQYSKGFM